MTIWGWRDWRVGAAAALVLTTALAAVGAPAWMLRHDKAETAQAARLALRRVAGRERAFFAANGRFALFAPGQERTAFPDLDLGAAAPQFVMDALTDARGDLDLRAVVRPDAVRDGRATPGMYRLCVPAPREARR